MASDASEAEGARPIAGEEEIRDTLALSLLSDRTLRFPRRPQLAADLSVFEMPEGLGVQFRGAEAPVVIRGRIASIALRYLLPKLDGSHDLRQLLILEPPEPLTQSTVAKTLSLMYGKGLIVSGPPADATTRSPEHRDTFKANARQARQRLFWGRLLDVTRSASSSQEIERRLATCSVVVIGTSFFGAATCDVLDRSGFESIGFFDWDDDGAAASAVEQFVSSAVHADIRSMEGLLSRIEPSLDGADLVITATRGAPAELYTRLNRLVIQRRIPLLRGDFDGIEYEIGPYVYPYGSPCLTCMRLRRSSALDAALEEEMYQKSLEIDAPAGTTPPIGESVPAAISAAGLLVADAVRAVSGIAAPTLLGQILTMSAVTGAMRTDVFARVARCPDCFTGELSGVLGFADTGHSER